MQEMLYMLSVESKGAEGVKLKKYGNYLREALVYV